MRFTLAARCACVLFVVSYLSASAAGAELSGAAWVAKFPGSKAIADLEDDFEAKVTAFHGMLGTAGATTTITSTLRPKERAFLMHWSWKIVKDGQDPQMIPTMAGVDINWWHGDLTTSKAKAQEMVNGYGINGLGVAPALNSRHTEGKAIDMQVTWSGNLSVTKKDGTAVTISSTPRDSTNVDLITVAATYGVIHFTNVAADKVHWSTDGH